MRRHGIQVIVMSVLLVAGSAWAQTTRTVCSSGCDHTTIQACFNAVVAGDTCLVSSGTYSESPTLSTTGTAGNIITIQGTGATKPVVTGTLNFQNMNYVTIAGLSLESTGNGIECDPFAGGDCDWIVVRDNDFDGNFIAVQIYGDDVLISGNTFDNQTNDIIRQHGDRWTIRNNTVVSETDSNDEHMDFWQSFCSVGMTIPRKGATETLIENNVYRDISGGNVHFSLTNSTDDCSGTSGVRIIVRYNRISDIGSRPFFIDANGQHPNALDNVLYNNTVVDTGGQTTWVANYDGSRDSSGINNLLYNATVLSGVTGFRVTTGWAQSYTLYFDPGGTMTFSGAAASETGAVKNQNPLFVNHATGNFTPNTGSPAIDAGGPLTTVAGADTGSGTALRVVRAEFFQPGWGGADPDFVAVGTVGNTVQIASINYGTNTLTLVSGISRSDGDPVWLYRDSDGTVVLQGSAPDIGAVETTIPPTDIPASGGGRLRRFANVGDSVIWNYSDAAAQQIERFEVSYDAAPFIDVGMVVDVSGPRAYRSPPLPFGPGVYRANIRACNPSGCGAAMVPEVEIEVRQPPAPPVPTPPPQPAALPLPVPVDGNTVRTGVR
jgi:hypothetical protein